MTYGMNGWNKNERAETHASDCISRAEAIDFFLEHGMITAAVYVERMLAGQPEPRRKKGRWSGSCCSVCGVSRYNFINILHTDSGYRGTWKYCPNCGAEMEVNK